MPRLYEVTFEGVPVSAAQDLFQITGAASRIVRVRRVTLSATDSTPPAAQMLQIRSRILPATLTNGSGGTTVTPARIEQGDAAATFTAMANNTTKATSSGSAVIIFEGGFYSLSDFDRIPLRPPTILQGTACVVELLFAPSGTLHLSGTCTVEEIG